MAHLEHVDVPGPGRNVSHHLPLRVAREQDAQALSRCRSLALGAAVLNEQAERVLVLRAVDELGRPEAGEVEASHAEPVAQGKLPRRPTRERPHSLLELWGKRARDALGHVDGAHAHEAHKVVEATVVVVVQMRYDHGVERERPLAGQGRGDRGVWSRVDEHRAGPVTDEDGVPLADVEHDHAGRHEDEDAHDDRGRERDGEPGAGQQHPSRGRGPRKQQEGRDHERCQLPGSIELDGDARVRHSREQARDADGHGAEGLDGKEQGVSHDGNPPKRAAKRPEVDHRREDGAHHDVGERRHERHGAEGGGACRHRGHLEDEGCRKRRARGGPSPARADPHAGSAAMEPRVEAGLEQAEGRLRVRAEERERAHRECRELKAEVAGAGGVGEAHGKSRERHAGGRVRTPAEEPSRKRGGKHHPRAHRRGGAGAEDDVGPADAEHPKRAHAGAGSQGKQECLEPRAHDHEVAARDRDEV